MNQFKPGAAKTRDGRDAWIFEVSDKIYGKRTVDFNNEMYGDSWNLKGFHNSDGHPYGGDLVPNLELITESFEADITRTDMYRVVGGHSEAKYDEFLSIKLPRSTQFKNGDPVTVSLVKR